MRKAKWIWVGYVVVVVVLLVFFLLSHYDGREYRRENLEEYVTSMCKLQRVPGMAVVVTGYEYATINYDVLALILEQVTKQDYASFIMENILQPLGMTDSYFRRTDDRPEQTSKGYKMGFFLPLEYQAPTFYGNTAAGYLVSSAKELTIWMNAQMGIFEENRDVPEVLRGAIEQSHLHSDDSQHDYFAGWELGRGFFGHGGNNPNFSSRVLISEDAKRAVFILSNLAGDSASNVGDGVFRLLLGEKKRVWCSPAIVTAIAFLIGCASICCFGSFSQRHD